MMCMKCFSSYQRLVDQYDTLKSALAVAAALLNLSFCLLEETPGQKRSFRGPISGTAKRQKPPPEATSATVVSIAHRDRTRSYSLTPRREKDAKSIARGNWKAVIT